MNRNHLTSWNQNRPIYFKIGLIISLTFCLLIINLEVLPLKNVNPSFEMDMNSFDFVEEKIHMITEPLTSKLLPKKSVSNPILNSLENLQILPGIPDVEMIPSSSSVTNSIIPTNGGFKILQHLKPKCPVSDTIMLASENMPYLRSCESLGSEEEIRQCTQKNILAFIQTQIKYPALAKEQGVEGTVLISFVISKIGELQNIQIVKDIGGGCGQNAANAIAMLGEWKPGKHRQQPVRVKMTVPITFKLVD